MTFVILSFIFGLFTRRELAGQSPAQFEREGAEGEGVFFETSTACEKKIRRPVKRDRARQSSNVHHKAMSEKF